MDEALRGRGRRRPRGRRERRERGEHLGAHRERALAGRVEERREARERHHDGRHQAQVRRGEDRLGQRNGTRDEAVPDHEVPRGRQQQRHRAGGAPVPRRAHAEVGDGDEEAVVRVGPRAPDRPHEHRRGDQAGAPVEPAQDHRQQGRPRHGRPGPAGHPGERLEGPGDRGRHREHVAGEDHERDLHAERQQCPDPAAPGEGALGRARPAHGEAEGEREEGQQGGDRERVGHPAGREPGEGVGEARKKAAHGPQAERGSKSAVKWRSTAGALAIR